MGRYLNLLCETNPAAASQGTTGDQSDKGDKRRVWSLMSLMSQPGRAISEPVSRHAADGTRTLCGEAAEEGAARPKAHTESASSTLLAPWFGQDPAEGEPPYDEPCPARRGVIRCPRGRFEHFCAVCGAWGAFGFGVTSATPGRWYCFQHRASG
jgi:hypothetical protein